MYQNFSKASGRKFELGESNYLEKITAQSKYRQIHTKLEQLDVALEASYARLRAVLQDNEAPVVATKKLEPIMALDYSSNKSLYDIYFQKVSEVINRNIALQKQGWLPDLSLEYFQGRNNGLSSSLYGFQVGISVPLFFGATQAKVKTAQLEQQRWEFQKQDHMQRLEQTIKAQQKDLERYQKAMQYYQETGKQLADEITKVADRSFKQGEIDFFQYIISLENATEIRAAYLDAVYHYNALHYQLHYLTLP